MSEQHETAPEEAPEVQLQAQPAPSPAPEQPKDSDKENKDKKEDAPAGVPASQLLLGGASATALSGFWVASAFGPWAAAGVGGAAAVTGGAAYYAHRRRKKGQAGMRRETTTVRKSSGGTSGLGKPSGFGGGKGGASPASSAGSSKGAAASGKRSTAAAGSAPGPSKTGPGSRSGSGSAGGSSRPGGASPGSKTAGSPRGAGGGQSPRKPGSSGGGSSLNPFSRKNSGRGSGGSGGPSGGGRGGSSGRRFGRKHSTPPGDGGMPDSPGSKGRTRSGSRWGRSGGSTGKTSPGADGRGVFNTKKKGGGSVDSSSRGASGGRGSTPRGRFARAAGRVGRWFDGKTGQRASTAWRAASGTKGFRARRQAARQALRNKSGRPVTNGAFAIVGALLAGLWSLGSRGRAAVRRRNEAAMDSVDPDTRSEHAAHTGPPGGDNDIPHQDDVERQQMVTDPTLPPQYTDAPKYQEGAATGATTTTGGTMAGLPHAQVATDMLSAAGRYEPDDAYTVVREARQWPDVSRDVAMSVRTYAQRLEGARFPLDQACLEKLQEFYTALSQTVSIAEEIEPLLRKAHQVDLERQENPRGDESKWNV